MKNIIFLVLFGITSLSAQESTEFETMFYFEDAVGNIDSILVAYDSEADLDYNPGLGEYDLKNKAWNDEFEVRATHKEHILNRPSQQFKVQSKKIVSRAINYSSFYDCSVFINSVVFLVRSTNHPITISWKKKDFNNSWCRVSSFIAAHSLVHGTEYWHEVPSLVELSECLAVAEEKQFNGINQWQRDLDYFMLDTLESGDVDTIGGIMLGFRYQDIIDSPCDADIVSTDDYSLEDRLSVFPNPSYGLVHFSEDVTNIEVTDLRGTLVKSKESGCSIDLSGLDSSIYFIRSEIDGVAYVRKVIIVE